MFHRTLMYDFIMYKGRKEDGFVDLIYVTAWNEK